MTATNTTNDTILDALLTDGLTLAGLAEATGLPCAELRAALDDLQGTSVTSEVANGKRTFYITDTGRCAREAVLAVLAEWAPEEELRAATRETLRAAARAYGVEGVKVKTTKEELIAAILLVRSTAVPLCAQCGEEPVEAAGGVCTVCDEQARREGRGEKRVRQSAKVARSDGDTRIRIRRPDVALGFSDEERANVGGIVTAAASQRAAQRDVGYWLASRSAERFCDAEILRTILRTHGALNPANFTINAKKEGWTRVEADGALRGWTIPAHVVKVTPRVEAKAAEGPA